MAFINYILDVSAKYFIIFQNFEDIFPTNYLKEEVINTMQVGFKVWQDILNGKDTNELYYSFYVFFMIASCTIVLKVISYIFNNF